MTATAEETRSATIPSAEELSQIGHGIGEGIGPVELVGMNFKREDDLELSDAEAWQLTALAKEAHCCADSLHEYAAQIEEQVGRFTETS